MKPDNYQPVNGHILVSKKEDEFSSSLNIWIIVKLPENCKKPYKEKDTVYTTYTEGFEVFIDGITYYLIPENNIVLWKRDNQK